MGCRVTAIPGVQSIVSNARSLPAFTGTHAGLNCLDTGVWHPFTLLVGLMAVCLVKE